LQAVFSASAPKTTLQNCPCTHAAIQKRKRKVPRWVKRENNEFIPQVAYLVHSVRNSTKDHVCKVNPRKTPPNWCGPKNFILAISFNCLDFVQDHCFNHICNTHLPLFKWTARQSSRPHMLSDCKKFNKNTKPKILSVVLSGEILSPLLRFLFFFCSKYMPIFCQGYPIFRTSIIFLFTLHLDNTCTTTRDNVLALVVVLYCIVSSPSHVLYWNCPCSLFPLPLHLDNTCTTTRDNVLALVVVLYCIVSSPSHVFSNLVLLRLLLSCLSSSLVIH
jgi:hypothetical protein